MPLICFFDLSTQKKVFVAFCYSKNWEFFFLCSANCTHTTIYKCLVCQVDFFQSILFKFRVWLFFQKTNAGFQIEKCPENANFFYNHKLLCTGNSITTVISRITNFLFCFFVIWFRYCTIHIICFFFNIRISFITIGIWLLCNSFTLWGNKK